MRIAFLDVGHGSAVVLSDGAEAVLLDAPPTPVVLEYLRSAGVQRLRHIVVSHADRDHLGGLVGLLHSGLVVDKVWIADDHHKRHNHVSGRAQFVPPGAARRVGGESRLSALGSRTGPSWRAGPCGVPRAEPRGPYGQGQPQQPVRGRPGRRE